MVIRGVVFDLDDTLYDERDYVRSGFEAVGRAAGRDDTEAGAIAAWLWDGFERGVRGDSFDRLRASFADVADRYSTADLVAVYRDHRPGIGLAPGIDEVIDTLAGQHIRLAIISDGPAESQQAKVEALGLDGRFEPILLTGRLGPAFHKPATPAFQAIETAWGLTGGDLAYVADNPEKDFVAPRALGWAAIRLRRPAQLRHDLEPAGDDRRPDVVVASADALLRAIGVVREVPAP